MHTASEAIYALKPVSFRCYRQYDRTQTIAFGLIAEDVAGVDRDLVGRNPAGQPESVRYEQINSMLLDDFLKEHRKGGDQDCKIQEQETTIAELRSEIQSGCHGKQPSIGIAQGERTVTDQQRRCAGDCEESVNCDAF